MVLNPPPMRYVQHTAQDDLPLPRNHPRSDPGLFKHPHDAAERDRDDYFRNDFESPRLHQRATSYVTSLHAAWGIVLTL